MVTAEPSPGVGDCARAGFDDAANTVGEEDGVADGVEGDGGRDGALVVCEGRGDDGAGGSDRTGFEVAFGTAEDGGTDGVRWAVSRCPGCVEGPDVLGEGATRVSVGRGRAVLEASGPTVRDGSGSSVGRDRSLEADGAGPGASPSPAVSPQIPRPPATRTAAPAMIHGALRGGLR
ncbi:hypothetical protein OG440_01335 [Streptomyces sp. NBC_00637]|uniref:hypothetical protein n=1 Tax=Streptomyces sp. NBC_00637 TaxID=2903667 RepID=UPI0032466006